MTESTEMRILTVRQPWSEAIIFGGKDVENRVTNIADGYRGPVAIHSAKRPATPDKWRALDAQYPDASLRRAETVPWPECSAVRTAAPLTETQVWALAKAEHDYVCDTNNIGAFVESRASSLRIAGVVFDEQPFIDGGYLRPLPAGGDDGE